MLGVFVMKFHPFDTLRIKENHSVVWVIEQEVPQGVGGYPAVGDLHPKHVAFKATYVGGATDCAGGTIIWEASFLAAPPTVRQMLGECCRASLDTYCGCCGAIGPVGEICHEKDCPDPFAC